MKNKFFIITTVPVSLDFFKGNLSFLKEYYDLCAISSGKDKLLEVGLREQIRTKYIPMYREISLLNDLISLIRFIIFFFKERPKIVHGNTPKAGLLSMIAAWLTRVSVRIYMCHGLRYQGCQGYFRKLLMLMEKISCFCASEVICVSHGIRETLIKDKICSHNKVVVIGFGSASGINLDYFNNNLRKKKRYS